MAFAEIVQIQRIERSPHPWRWHSVSWAAGDDSEIEPNLGGFFPSPLWSWEVFFLTFPGSIYYPHCITAWKGIPALPFQTTSENSVCDSLSSCRGAHGIINTTRLCKQQGKNGYHIFLNKQGKILPINILVRKFTHHESVCVFLKVVAQSFNVFHSIFHCGSIGDYIPSSKKGD